MMKLLGKPSAVPTLNRSTPLRLNKQQGLQGSSTVDLLAAIKASQAPPLPERKDTGNPIFNIPILGPALDLIDTPRAAIVSGLKEIGDIFDGDESFSARDWWRQTDDNIFMGEVLRDWGVDLPGPLDFALGLTLDIAFDPLTYMLPLGPWARMANKRIGLGTGIQFSIPLSGRLGQGIFERPLRMIPGLNAKWGKWMDAQRVKQLGQVNVGPGGKWAVNKLDATKTGEFGFGIKQGFDIANPYNLKKVGDAVFRLNSANPVC